VSIKTRLWRSVSLIAWICVLSGLVAAADKPFPEDEIHPLLSTSLQSQWRETTAIAPQGAIAADPNREVTVILEPVSGRASRIQDSAVRMAGGHVVARSRSLVRVQIPVGQLEELADTVSGILWIREPLRPVPLAVESQGVALTGASDFHDAGITGSGVKVAVIDLGFDGLTEAQAAGELQNVVYTMDYTGSGLEADYVHGTGVAEIVEDMAPDAELYLLKIGDSVDLENAMQYCIEQDVRVINHSVGWYNSNYYDGTGIIGTIASNARDNGILWVNSAGNEAADGHWQGDFTDADSDLFHDFGPGADFVDGDGIDEGGRVYAASGDTLVVYLSWNDWTASDQDYDLYLYDSAGDIVDASTGWQSGTQSPTEAIFHDVTASGYYEIVVYQYNAPDAPEFEIFCYLDSGADTGFEYHDPTSSIIAPANSSDVVAVGAIRAGNWTTGPQETFSSRGPSNDSLYASSRTKPDISGADGTLSTTYGLFYGTSAASPHVAGAAALLLSEDPGRSADNVQTLLELTAIDMGTAGKDNLYGAGRLNLVLTTYSDPRAYWQLNEGSGSVAGDSSVNGNDGTIVGASWVGGSPDETAALSFDGTGDYVQVPDDGSLRLDGEFTLEAWICPTDIVSSAVVTKRGTYADAAYGLWLKDGHLRGIVLTHDRAAKAVVMGTTVLTSGTWVHVAMVRDAAGEISIWVNGVQEPETAVAAGLIDPPEPLYIGRHSTSLSQDFEVVIDEVRLSASALDPGEFNLLPGGPPAATPPGLVNDFAASDGADSQSVLTWTNPGDADLGRVVVQRKTGGYPADHTDGTTVYDNASPTPGDPISTTDTGLTNGTTYYYAVFGRDATDWNDTVSEGSNADTALPEAGVSPPGQVTDFTASDGANEQSVLTWTNPSDGDLGRVVVQRKTGGYPADHTDGTTVYDNASPTPGDPISTTDTGLTNGTTYYYAVFGRDATDWNDTVSEGDNADTGTPSAPAAPGEYAAYWRLNEGARSVAGDSSGNGNDGTISGASWVSGSPDETTALSFDGTGDYVEVPDDASLRLDGAFTLEAWICPTDVVSSAVVTKR